MYRARCTLQRAPRTWLPRGSAALELLQEHSQEKTTWQTGLDWGVEVLQPPSQPPLPPYPQHCARLCSQLPLHWLQCHQAFAEAVQSSEPGWGVFLQQKAS